MTDREVKRQLTDEGTIEVRWSRQILAEMSRNLRENLGLSHDSWFRHGWWPYDVVDVLPSWAGGMVVGVLGVNLEEKPGA